MAQKKPKESAQILIGIHEQIEAASQYSMRVFSSVTTEGDPYYAWMQNYAGLSTPVTSNIACMIYPGRLYTFQTGSNSWNPADVHFDIPAGYTMYVGFQNWPMTARTSFLATVVSSNTCFMNFYVVPSDGAAWLSPGYARPPHVGDVTWAISAGSLSCGASAGSLRWQSSTVSQSLLDPTSLTYTPSAVTNLATATSYQNPVTDQIAIYQYPNGAIKYVGTSQVQIYVAGTPGSNSGYTVTVYQPGTAYTWTGGNPAVPWNFNGATYSEQYVVSNPDPTWAGRVQIVKTDGVSGKTETWILSQSGSTTSLTQTSSLRVITLVSTPIAGGRTETYTVANNSGVVATSKLRTFQTFPWGEELVSEVADPSGLALTTTYTYYNTTWGDGHYGKLQSVTHPDGSWILYNYYDDFAHCGELASVSTPWQDAPINYSAATATNCKVTTYNYAPQVYDGYQSSTPITSASQTLDGGTQTSINGIVTGHTIVSPNIWLSSAYNTSLFANEPMRTDTIQSFSASGVAQTTIKSVFHNTSDPVYNGKLYFQTNPDGTKTSASYWKGDFTSYLGPTLVNLTSVTPDTTSACWISTYLTGTATQQDPGAVLYSTDGITGGKAIDPVWMTPFKSYRRHVVNDALGHPVADYTQVFTGSGFQIISWHTTFYTWDGMLQDEQYNSGGEGQRGYVAGLMVNKVDPDGTFTVYNYDSLNRVSSSQKVGVPGTGPYPAQQNIVTNFSYDAASNVTSKSTQSAGGGPTLSSTSVFNLACLLTSQTDATNLTTTYSYTNGGRTVTTTLPNGSTQVTDKHLDGSAKSVTGNAQVNQFTSSVVNGDGTITTTTNLGTSGSSRLSSTQTDWLGRTISQTQPAFGSGSFVKQSFFNTAGQLTKTTQTGMSATLYQYDGLGQLQYSGLDVNNNGVLDLGGSDRITETRSQVLIDANSFPWNQTQTFAFNLTGNATPVLVSDVRQKLAYPSTLSNYQSFIQMSETDSYDFFGNLTVETVSNAQGTTISTDTTTLPNSSVPKVAVKFNGLLMSSQTPQNIVTTYQYDGLGREISEVDPRKGTSTTAYFTSGTGELGQVSTQTDAAGNSTIYTYGSTDGRLSSQTDALGDVVYHAYDHAGREIKTWGNGTFPVEYAFDVYGAQIAMRTFRSGSINFSAATWPLSDDGSDPQNPSPASWTNGDKTTWTLDGPTGLLSSKTDASAHSVAYTYSPNGKLATRTWARGVVTTYSYDPNTAEQTGIAYSDGTPGLTYAFDRLGHGTSIAQAFSGFTLTTGLQYNVPGKLTQENFDSAYFSGRQLVYQLDMTNIGTKGRTIGFQLGTSSSPGLDETTSYGYDSDARLNSVGLSGGPTFTYAFAANSNLIGSITDTPDNWSQTRTWDSHRDLMDVIQTSAGGSTIGNFTYVYDALGRRRSRLETGALFSRYPAAGLVDAYQYDSKSEVTGDQAYQSVNQTTPTNPVLGRGFTFAFDPIGNRTTSSVDSTENTSYTTNALNQITSRAVPGYYPASGFAPSGATVTLNGSAIPAGQFSGQYYFENVTVNNSAAPLWLSASLSSSLGGSVTANAFVPQTPEASSYDADGNLLTDGRWNYFWDGENRLKAIETYGKQTGNTLGVWNSGVPLIHLDFKYDYKGRRISKVASTWNGSAFAPSYETRYAYENWNLIADYTLPGSPPSLTLAHSYLWGIDLSGKLHGAGGVGGLLAMASTGGTELPTYDSNGNVQGLTDRSNSQITAAYEYSPYGQPLRAAGSFASSNPFRFSTKFTDVETDFVYYSARYYNAALGRFLGRDPMEEKGGLHLYAFVGNNSVNSWDYLGNMKMDNWIVVYNRGLTAGDYGTGGNAGVDTRAIDFTPDPFSTAAEQSPPSLDALTPSIDPPSPNEPPTASSSQSAPFDPADVQQNRMDPFQVNETPTSDSTESGSVGGESMINWNAGRNETGVGTTEGGTNADDKKAGKRKRADQDDQLTPPTKKPKTPPPPQDPLKGLFPGNPGGLPPLDSPPKDLLPYGSTNPPINPGAGSPWPTHPGYLPSHLSPSQTAVVGVGAGGTMIIIIVILAPVGG